MEEPTERPERPGPTAMDLNGIQVAVRVRPLNPRELGEGHRVCVSFDEPTKQVVLTAVDKSTLFQLRGAAAKGYAFDRRYDQQQSAVHIYEDCVAQLVECCFKGYNATVLAYGQTGSGKTHTMAGGIGIHGIQEEGITPLVIRHIFSITEALRRKAKSGEKIIINACGLELYNEDLRDLAAPKGEGDNPNWGGKNSGPTGLKLLERPGKDGRVVPEVVGIKEVEMNNAEEMMSFFNECVNNRSVSSTKLNDRSSRSHAIFTITINRTIITVLNELDENFKAKVRTEEVSCKLHLVDLAGSERVKRSGVTGKELKEATHINSGLLALGNVIVALSGDGDGKGKKGHVPYRDSKLTRLLQDSLGGNSLTVLISCISPSEQDFEETNNTLKYANRACKIKNSPLPNRFTALEEDLLPMLPSSNNAGFGLVQLQALLEEHGRLKEVREKREKDKKDKDAKRLQMLSDMKESEIKTPGFRRLRAVQYDELRRQMASRGTSKNKTSIPSDVVIADDTLAGLRRKQAIMTSPATSPPATPVAEGKPSYMRTTAASRVSTSTTKTMDNLRISSSSDRIPSSRTNMREKLLTAPTQQASRQRSSFADWMAAQEQEDGAEGDEHDEHDEEYLGEDEQLEGTPSTHSQEGHEPVSRKESQEEEAGGEPAADPESAHVAAPEVYVARGGPSASKSKFKRPAPRVSGEGSTIPIAEEPTADAAVAAAEEVAAVDDTVEGEDSGVDVSTAVRTSESGVTTSMELDDETIAVAEEEMEEEMDDLDTPKMLARFRVNQHDTLAVFKANTKEDFKDVIGLLPENTPLPASDKMTYLLARLETSKGADLTPALQQVGLGNATMNDVVGPAVGCLMATFGTNMIASCIFDFDDPPELELYAVDERIELWGLQIPHNSVRPALPQVEGEPKEDEEKEKEVIHWTSVDRLNMSIGLLYALCNYAIDNDVRCGFCVPRPQLLRRWLQAGVKMNQITGNMRLIYPPTAHDYEYYKTSTVAYFMVDEVKAALEKVISIVD